VIEGVFWRSNKKEISEWLEGKEQEFSQKENKNPCMRDKQWIQRHAYTKLHEIFLGEIAIILTE
jgi:hypothetical protein